MPRQMRGEDKENIMVNLKGQGSMSDVNLVARSYGVATKDGKSAKLEIAVDHREPRVAGQSNLNLRTVRRTDKEGQPMLNANGKQLYDNGAWYTEGQAKQIEEAGTKVPVLDKDGKEIDGAYDVYFKAEGIKPASRGGGLVVNTAKQLEPSDYKSDVNTARERFAVVEANARAQRAAREEQAAAPAPEAEQAQEQQAQAEADQPAY